MVDDDSEPKVARFEEAPGHSELYIDTAIPGHFRTVYNLIGTNVGEDPESEAAIEPAAFNLCVVEAPPGNGAALHDHETVEVFMPLTGTWEVYYGDDGEESVSLEPWDAVQIPPGVFRGFRNAGEGDAYLLALTDGVDPGRVTWPESLEADAERHGLRRDEEGNLVRTD